jgi:arylsulfatase A-like enzyme
MPRAKMWLHDSGLRVPLIVRVPEKWRNRFGVQPGAVDDRLVSLIDLTATSLDMAGMAKPAWMQGRVLFGARREPSRDYVFGARDNLTATIMRNRTVRTRRYRYIRNFTPNVAYKDVARPWMELSHPHWLYLRLLREKGQLTSEQKDFLTDHLPEEELYDLETDPFETHNLAGDPRYAEQLDQMRRTLEEWIQSSDDRGAEPTDPEIIKASYRWEQKLRELYNKTYFQPLKKRGLPVLPFEEIVVDTTDLQ